MVYKPTCRLHQAKSCLRKCAKCTDLDSSHTFAKSHLGICSPLIHSIVSNDSVSRSEGPDQTACLKTSFCLGSQFVLISNYCYVKTQTSGPLVFEITCWL